MLAQAANSPRWRGARREQGFSLVELALVLTAAAAVVAVGAISASGARSEARDASGIDVSRAFEAHAFGVQAFATAFGRLPCPDTNSDGDEDCGGSNLGELPHASMGLPDRALDVHGRPLRYVVASSLMASTDLDQPSWNVAGRDADDFCAALKLRLAAGFLGLDLAVAAPGGTVCNAGTSSLAAFALVSGGVANADDDAGGDFFDGGNSPASQCVMSPQKPQQPGYDDQSYTVGLAELAGVYCK